MTTNVLITGASGHVGNLLMNYLATHKAEYQIDRVVGVDIKPPRQPHHEQSVFYQYDIRSAELKKLFAEHQINAVIHLASIVTPPKGMSEETMYSIDVKGTEYILNLCDEFQVERLSVSSSGAAYGYYADNPEWLREEDPIRGNEDFAYSRHKRLVEELLERHRKEKPALKIFNFRICTILGESISNQITDLFKKPFLIGLQGSETPFVFIWDDDVVKCFAESLRSDRPGNYNLAGDGKMTIYDLSEKLKKPKVLLPVALTKGALKVLKRFKLTQYGDEQVQFLQYRPVLLNEKLKSDFGYRPQKTSAEVFDYFLEKNLFGP